MLAPADTSGKVTACANRKSGAMRLLTKGKCASRERTVTWGTTGPRGARGPAGSVTVNGGKCADTQYLGFDGERWTCVSAPVTAFLYSEGATMSFSTVDQGFKARSANVDGGAGCNKETCVVRLFDVRDHQTCTAELWGAAFTKDAEVLPGSDDVLIDFGPNWSQGEKVTISISCLR